MRVVRPVVVLAALLTLLAVAPAAPAYPIPAQTLWALTQRASLVVVARVEDSGKRAFLPEGIEEAFARRARGEETEEDRRAIDALRTGHARLVVCETWKGEAPADLVVAYVPGLVCPAPPRFVEGETVLAFLCAVDGEWQTVGLSYGTLYPPLADLPVFRARVSAAMALLARDSTEAERTAWLVDTAIEPATRWHGLYPLEPSGDRIRSYYDQDRTAKARPALTEAQRRAIADGFVASPTIDVTLPMTLELLEACEHQAFTDAAVAAMDAAMEAHSERVPYWTGHALDLLLPRLGIGAETLEPPVAGESDDPGEWLAADPLVRRFNRLDARELRALWQDVRAGLDREPPALSAPPSGASRVRGVGPDTPP